MTEKDLQTLSARLPSRAFFFAPGFGEVVTRGAFAEGAEPCVVWLGGYQGWAHSALPTAIETKFPGCSFNPVKASCRQVGESRSLSMRVFVDGGQKADEILAENPARIMVGYS
ncbi:hypothetical protein [Caballeronia sp. LZ043]|uniref:hypothetical protein n=1 Tax=Caballeronia sp. LZ043 TaxID=3038569 RepID=UPI0028636041|nr:hypothetical protein [Caballeronia sp. LZ043]MDR5819563.1 hypothetical protein [Caballeronia sp. LZ043]